MKSFLFEHIDELKEICSKNGIAIEDILNSPKSFNENIMYIYEHNPKLGENGLLDETPAKVLLVIKKKDNKLLIERINEGEFE